MKVLQNDYNFYLLDSYVQHKNIILYVHNCSSDYKSIIVRPTNSEKFYKINPNKLSYKYFNIGYVNGVYFYNLTNKLFRFGMHQGRCGMINPLDKEVFSFEDVLISWQQNFLSFDKVLKDGKGSWHKNWYLEKDAVYYKGFVVGSIKNGFDKDYEFLKGEFDETTKANSRKK